MLRKWHLSIKIRIWIKYSKEIYNELLEFKKGNGKYALLIEGARHVGKSTIVKEFGKKEYK